MDKTEKLIDSTEDDREDRDDDAQFESVPDPNEVDNIGRAMGVTYQENEELKAGEKEESRDRHRWELDPASADDYQERTRDESK